MPEQLPQGANELITNILNTTRIFSPSGMESEMSQFCSIFLYGCGFSIHTDANGNIMAVRGKRDKYVLLNAHMDTYPGVIPMSTIELYTPIRQQIKDLEEYIYDLEQDISHFKRRYLPRRIDIHEHSEIMSQLLRMSDEYTDAKIEYNRLYNIYVSMPDNIVRKRTIDPGFTWRPECINFFTKSNHISAKTKGCSGKKGMYIGGDDKAGVGIILTLAQLSNVDMKILLTVREEPPFGGKGGVRDIPNEFFNDIAFDVTLDKGYGNLLVNEIGNKKICDDNLSIYISDIAKQYCNLKYKITHGMMCDAQIISEQYKVPSVNLSTGYYGAHDNGDYINVPETHQSLCVANWVVKDFNQKN